MLQLYPDTTTLTWLATLIPRWPAEFGACTCASRIVGGMASDQHRERLYALAPGASKLATYTSAVGAGGGAFTLGSMAVVSWTFWGAVDLPWWWTVLLPVLSGCAVFLINPRGPLLLRVGVPVVLGALVTWFLAVGGGLLGYALAAIVLCSIPHVVIERPRG